MSTKKLGVLIAGFGVDAFAVAGVAPARLNDGYGSFWNIEGTQQTSGQVAVAGGDSGGPVLTVDYNNGAYTTVGAAGMIQFGSNPVACGSVNIATTCFARVDFSSVHTFLNDVPGTSLVV